VSEAIAWVSFEQFLDAEAHAARRSELVGGRVYAMAGGSERHDLAAGLVYEAVAPGARAAGCRPFTANRLVRTEADGAYYPDVMVVCGAAPDRTYETDPALVVEVLSRSTVTVDRREKAIAYAARSTLRLLLLVHPDERRIEAASPADGKIRSWQVYGPGDVLRTGFGDIDVDALYDELDRTSTTT